MLKLGTLLIESPQFHKREDKTYETIPGEYDIMQVVHDSRWGYMAEIDAMCIEDGTKVRLILGGGWYSQAPYEIPNFGLGKFTPCVDELPIVGDSTQLVANPKDLQ